MNRKQEQSRGIGFCGLLAVAFIVLRLCGVIGWSWVWVLAPIWGPVALILILSVLYAALDGMDKKRGA